MRDWCHAERISTAVAAQVRAPGPAGHVHSVFRSAVNLIVHGELVTLALSSTGGLPNGIVLEESIDLTSLGLAPGQFVGRDGDRLCFGSRLVVDLRGASPWSPELPAEIGPLRPLEMMRAALARALDQASCASPGGFWPLLRLAATDRLDASAPQLPPACAAALPAIRRLLAAVDVGDLQAALEGAGGLVGLGDGLTPSGDDFLIGFSAAQRAARTPANLLFAVGCAGLARGRTTRVAEMFLEHAARGAYSERIQRLVAALADPSASDGALADCLAEGLNWGASSGADTLLGLVCGSRGLPLIVGNTYAPAFYESTLRPLVQGRTSGTLDAEGEPGCRLPD